MTDNLHLPGVEAEFQLRIRQALLAAQNSTRQVGLLLISFEDQGKELNSSAPHLPAIHNSILLRLRNGLRESDTVSVLADNRIGVLLSSIIGYEDIELVIKRLVVGLKESYCQDGITYNLDPRIGVAIFPEHCNNVTSLLQRAEDALNQAWLANNSYALYSGLACSVPNSRQWMSELRHAIVSDHLSLVYQPKVSLSAGQLTGVEVLTRWRHPKLGTIAPDQFIPIAERTGLIIPLTLWVLQQALRQCRIWQEMGLDLGVAVNLSMWNLESHELPGQIEGLLRDTGVSPTKLELEITESTIMNDPERVIQTLSLIRNQGVRFAIDDFGTGYSSFAYLKRLPVACIKIDKSFIHNIETDRDNAIIVKSITDLAHNLGLKVVAEGVESSPAKSLLTSFKCDEGQGFYFSRPITSKTLTDILLTSPNGRNIPGDAGAGLRIPQGCEMIDRLPLNAGRQIELHEE